MRKFSVKEERLNIPVSKELKEAIEKVCEEKDCSVSSFVRDAILLNLLVYGITGVH